MDYSPIISGEKWTRINLTYNFLTSISPTYAGHPEYAQTFAPVTSAMQAEINSILQPNRLGENIRPAYFSDVSGLTFSQISDVGDIAIGSYAQSSNSPASAYLPNKHEYGGDIWLGLDFTIPSSLGEYAHFVLVHEIAHSLGLEHGNIYPPSDSPTNLPNLATEFDSMKYTVMSYNFHPDKGALYPVGLQQFDIAALQEMYGVNYNTRDTDSVYSFTNSPGLLTIWDGGRIDWIDVQGFTDRVIIDLQPGNFSSIGGVENVAMSLVAHLPTSSQSLPLIENARGGAGNDDLTGNNGQNVLLGGNGSNKLNGMNGNDTLVSEGIYDILDGGAGGDALINSQRDGNTTYVFSRGYGHDGIIDNPTIPGNIDVFLKGLQPGDIELFCERCDLNLERPQEQQESEPDYMYGPPILRIISTGDTIVLPWIYRSDAMRDTPPYSYYFDYSGDSIQFEDGPAWDMQNYEDYVSIKDVASRAELETLDPVFFAWMTNDLAPWFPN